VGKAGNRQKIGEKLENLLQQTKLAMTENNFYVIICGSANKGSGILAVRWPLLGFSCEARWLFVAVM
jgi:hypothetical protein